MKEDVLRIPAKKKGEDGYKVFSVRLRDEVVAEIESLSAKSGRSRNELIGMLLQFALDKCEIVD